MTTVILILACIVTVSCLLKVSMMSTRTQCVVAVAYGLFAWLSMGWMTEVSHDMFTQLLTARPTRLNIGVCITLEAMVMMAWCFRSPLTSHPSPLTSHLLSFYPGLLFAAAISFVQAQMLWLLPGSDFTLLAWLSALGVMLLIMGGSRLLRWLTGSDAQRKEMLFIVNLLALLLCIIITGG